MTSILNFANNDNIYAQAPLFAELLAGYTAHNKKVILVYHSVNDLAQSLDHLYFFYPHLRSVLTIPAHEDSHIYSKIPYTPLARMTKLASYFQLALGNYPAILLTSYYGLLERIPNNLLSHAQILTKKDHVDRACLIKALFTLGYTKVMHVSEKGSFAVRGSIIDIFIAHEDKPIRLDFFGDEIESIKYFDENSQRSLGSIDTITIGPAQSIIFDNISKKCAHHKLKNLADEINFPTTKLKDILRQIDDDTYFYGIDKLWPAFNDKPTSSILDLYGQNLPHIIYIDKDAIFASINNFIINTNEHYNKAIVNDLIFSPHEYYLDPDDLKHKLYQCDSFNITSINTKNSITFLSKATSYLRDDILKASLSSKDDEPYLLKPLAVAIKLFHQQEMVVILPVSSKEHEDKLIALLNPLHINMQRLKNLDNILDAHDLYKPHIQAYTLVSNHDLHEGAIFTSLKLVFIAENDIFGKRSKRGSGKKHSFATSIGDLAIDDYVVHLDHGVGQFKGLVRLAVLGIEHDYILIHYAHNEKLYVPTHKINLIKPHGGNNLIKLDKLGGHLWANKKNKVNEAVMAMAQELLSLYAKREVVTRPPFMAPNIHFAEFAESFAFETTKDQQKAIDDVINDMQQHRPMDRLVCGDVGFGKTEVAMRAAMLAILSNKQVVILAPTTVLAQQHGLTFKERFKNTGAHIAVLSRFLKSSEVNKIIDDISNHKIDIVIGTHRLLSPDIKFSDLGLIIIDEEQRFGIKAKEHMKRMRTKADILAMSATPIPRTLQMSYLGIRDLSMIETPPIDRRVIETQVVQFDDDIIKEAINRELSRHGQIYFVNNRIQNINAMKDYLQLLVPHAKIMIAHGQMAENDLEMVMLSFINHDIDILVCTTIIETGIDVPRANTMFINHADDFGLSQLYQLRGRIGRSSDKAFAYLLIEKPAELLTPIAKTRLEILYQFSELGAGFRIAQHDLELRGAGDLLGKSQHGHISAVGYDLYAELLKNAVKTLKGQKDAEAIDPEIVLPISALLKENYCPDLQERMSFYQQLANADSIDKLKEIFLNLEDQYGPPPQEALALKISQKLKIALKSLQVQKLELKKNGDDIIVIITPSPHVVINKDKILAHNMKITPQHKIIQTFKSKLHHDINDEILHIGMLAIKNSQSILT